MSVLSSGESEVCTIDSVEIAVEPWQWEFAARRRAEIDRHFADRRRQRPGLWNGRVLLLNRYTVNDGALRGACFETDYASFLTWRDWDFPDAGVFNFFAAAAVQAVDGAYVVGEMAQATAGAGQHLFPCGTPDPSDLDGGKVDLVGSLGRELHEETGLDIGALSVEPNWHLVRDRGFVALIKQLTARESAEELCARIMRHLANEADAELSNIKMIHNRADLDPRMPPFVVAFLEEVWRNK